MLFGTFTTAMRDWGKGKRLPMSKPSPISAPSPLSVLPDPSPSSSYPGCPKYCFHLASAHSSFSGPSCLPSPSQATGHASQISHIQPLVALGLLVIPTYDGALSLTPLIQPNLATVLPLQEVTGWMSQGWVHVPF